MSHRTLAPARTADAHGARAPRRWYAAIGLTLLPGCAFERYSREPLESEGIVHELVEERRSVFLEVVTSEDSMADVLHLDEASDLLAERNPEVHDARAAYRTAAAAAAEKTPFPNPNFALGPEFGFGPDAASPFAVPLVRLGVTIPTAGKRSKLDDVVAARATELRVQYLTTCAAQYLELRRKYVALAVARTRVSMHEEIVRASKRSLDAVHRLIEAGSADATDVSLFRLEHARERARKLEADRDLVTAEADFAALISVSTETIGALPPSVLPEMPDCGRDLDGLLAALPETHAELLRAEAAYELADRELRLEVAKQYPDLVLAGELKGETGESVTVTELLLGFGLPLFDRNQREIARATARRVQARVAYRGAAARAIARLERFHRAAELAEQRRDVLRDEVLPAAVDNVELLHRSLPAGSDDALQVLDAERSLRQVELEVLEAELELQLAWSDLERAFGAPLLDFASGDTNESIAEEVQ